jgi:hypothetical protein
LLLTVLLLAIFLFYQRTIRDGHTWDDDAAQYILHARNIAEGRDYADTGYIFNPQYANLGPPAYPPGFPLLLAPIWAARGLDLNAMKILSVICFVGSLGLIYGLFWRRLGAVAALTLVGVFGFCPTIWQQKEFIGSDFPFLLFAYLAVLAMDHFSLDTQSRIRDAILIAPLIAIAYSVRTAGLVLLPVVACRSLLKSRRLSPFLLVTVLLTVAFCGAEALWMHSIGASVSLFHIHPGTIIRNIWSYGVLLRSFWSFGGHATSSWLLNGLIAALALIGFANQVRSREGIGIVEIFAILYTAMLLIYAPVETRFLYPVIPIYVGLALKGAEDISARIPARLATAAGCSALAMVSLCYAAQYRQLDWGPIPGSVLDEDFVQVADFIGSHTADNEVLLFRKPRFLALLTGRKAATYAHVPGLGSFVRNLRPGIIVAATSSGDGSFASDGAFLWPFLRARAGSLQVIYTTPGYSVFRMRW